MTERPDPAKVTVTISELKARQARLGLLDVHLVWLGPDSFTVAHTDAERASGEPLEDCDLHRWLIEQDGPPEPVGLYVAVPHEPDAYSEPYMAERWDLIPEDR